MAYNACNKVELNKFDLLESPDVRYCCESLFEMINVVDDLSDGDDDRRTMFSRFDIDDDLWSGNRLCEVAAFQGHIDCPKFAREIGVARDSGLNTNRVLNHIRIDMCYLAAKSGNLECLRYASENGCPWDERTCNTAAMNLNTDCLVYALENGCPSPEEKIKNKKYL